MRDLEIEERIVCECGCEYFRPKSNTKLSRWYFGVYECVVCGELHIVEGSLVGGVGVDEKSKGIDGSSGKRICGVR